MKKMLLAICIVCIARVGLGEWLPYIKVARMTEVEVLEQLSVLGLDTCTYEQRLYYIISRADDAERNIIDGWIHYRSAKLDHEVRFKNRIIELVR